MVPVPNTTFMKRDLLQVQGPWSFDGNGLKLIIHSYAVFNVLEFVSKNGVAFLINHLYGVQTQKWLKTPSRYFTTWSPHNVLLPYISLLEYNI